MVDLDLATNIELITELTERHNFVGVVVYSVDEHLKDGQVHNSFAIAARGGSKDAVSELLAKMSIQLMENENEQ